CLRRDVEPSGDGIDVVHLRDAWIGDDGLVRHGSPAAVFVASWRCERSSAACSRAACRARARTKLRSAGWGRTSGFLCGAGPVASGATKAALGPIGTTDAETLTSAPVAAAAAGIPGGSVPEAGAVMPTP